MVGHICLLHEISLLDAFTEVALVDRLSQDSLEDMLQLCEREHLRQEIETQWSVVDASAELHHGIVDHQSVVGVHLRKLVERDPLETIFFSQRVVLVLYVDERTVGYRHHSVTRVTVYFTEGANLTHIHLVEPCQFK